MKSCLLCDADIGPYSSAARPCRVFAACRTGQPCCEGCCTHRGDYLRPGDRIRVRTTLPIATAGRQGTVIIVHPFKDADALAIVISLDEPMDPTIAASAEWVMRPRELEILR